MHPIKDYFLIGDLHTAALVSAKGSIDWLCMPSFDSPSVFGAILDTEKGGTFALNTDSLKPLSAAYVPDTAIVQTEFAAADGSFQLRDFMLPRPTEEAIPHYLIRTLKGLKGKTTVQFFFDPRPDYARQGAIIENGKHYHLRLGDRTLYLHLPKDARVTHHRKGGLDIEIDIAEGETKEIVLECSVESRIALLGRNLEKETTDFWKQWIAQGIFFNNREHLVRSAITLKLMQFYPTGGLIAAPTTSLPEEIGGVRNWDYRYVWMRDATFTLYAFYVLGFVEEARKFFGFIERIAEQVKKCEGDTCDIDLSVMYTIWGNPLQGEDTLAHLDGYANSKPVRIGNGAAGQFQLDMYGSVIDAYYFMSKRGLDISAGGRDTIRMLVRGIATNWKRVDSGIWEVRGGDKNFTYSKIMAWMGVERALRLKEQLKLTEAEEVNWEKLKKEIEDWIWAHCFDAERQTFRQFPETSAQDATNFLFVILFFLSRHDPKAKAMIESTRKELAKDDLYIYRYLTDDGIQGGEGAFIFCTFWQIAALAAVGELQKAEELMQRFEKLMPDSGLIAEEIDPKTGEYLGNHPQAFSHIGYILSAFYIHRYTMRPQDGNYEPQKN
jgi:GH15 family glucan-1,4-alpha-glucosidase